VIRGCLSQGVFLDFADLFQQVRPMYVRRSRTGVVSIVTRLWAGLSLLPIPLLEIFSSPKYQERLWD